MSQIEKLKILGVRSFGIKGTGETIQFDAPLTLIVGYNGSGKTTIIECLKYATTGQLPPNSKTGGAFVHDPKLAAEKEVLAQVKLQFRNTTGNKMVVTRSMSVKVKKTGLSQTTLECQLLMTHRGERTSISTRVGELDKIVPINLGVSPAILESVIFCHQDESLWPMSEPAALKKRFDNIFEAQKYTKAVDALKVLRKGKVDALKLLKQEEEHSKALKDKAEKVQKRSLDLEDELESLRKQIAEYKDEMDAASAIAKEKHEQKNQALGIVDALKTKTERVRNLQETLDTLGTNLDELQESDEWLQSTLEQYEDRMAQYRDQQQEYRSQYSELLENIQAAQGNMSEKQAERGRHQAAKDTYENQVRSRVELAREAARTHSIRGYEDDLDEDQISDFVQRVQKLSQEKDRELDRIQKVVQDELRQIQEILDDLGVRRSTKTQEKVNARQAIEANSRKSRVKQQDVDRIKMDDGTKASLDATYRDLQARLQVLSTEYDAKEWDATLRTENNSLAELNTEALRLKAELMQSNKLATDRAQLDVYRDNVKDQRRALDTMKATHDNHLQKLIGPEWEVDTLERDFQLVIDQKSRTLDEAKMKQASLTEEVKDSTSKIKAYRTNLVRKREEKQKCYDVVIASITKPDGSPLSNIDEYQLELEDLKVELEDLQKQFDGKAYVSEYYKKCLDIVDKHNTCRLCRRNFANTSERSMAIDKINQEIAKYAKGQLDKQLEEFRNAMKKADAARTQFDMYNALVNVEIPAIESDIKQAESERAPRVRELEEQDADVAEKEAAKREAESLTQIISKIVGYVTDISKHEESINRLSSQQKFSGSSLTIGEIEDQSSANDEQVRTQMAKIHKLTSERDSAKAMINNLEREAGVVLNQLNAARYDMEKKQDLLAAVEELRGNTLQQREVIQQADVELEALSPKAEQARAQLEDAKQRGLSKEKDVRVEKEKLAETVNRFRLIENAINSYTESGGPAKLKACLRAIKELEQDQKSMGSEQERLTVKVNELKKRVDDSEKTKRSIQDNINYRKTLSSLHTAKREVQELDTRNAEDDYEAFRQEAEAADNRFAIASGKRSQLIGEMASKDRELGRYVEEWEIDYKDAAPKYRESHIMVKTNEAAVDDLGKFTKALDSAIMQYHTMKMQEINSIAGELWRSTYQGTDVDTIMIRSENENASSKRNYNYRVVMVKQDAEMDMRGRCSAGQKVLASIIIRLALAECFGVNCGVIALDEPTTNLDRDNIKSLAESLNKIIKNRKHQSNFQLIIITHDEEFLKDMKCSEFTDNYYRVSRDADQKSMIERQSLADFV